MTDPVAVRYEHSIIVEQFETTSKNLHVSGRHGEVFRTARLLSNLAACLAPGFMNKKCHI